MKNFAIAAMVIIGGVFFANFDLDQILGAKTSKIKNIERVLNEDSTTTEGATSVANVVTRMNAIDLSGSPNDFKAAYVAHIHAWELMADVEKEAIAYDANFNSVGAFLEAFLRGVMLDPFGKANEAIASQKQLRANYQRASDQIRDTFHRVEELAVSYGASLSQKHCSNDSVANIKGEWRGTCAQSNMAPYPIVMLISTQNGTEISGTINWPTLRNSTTRFNGTINGNNVRFVETELIVGSGIGIPCIYEGELLGKTIVGTCVYAGQKALFAVTCGTH